MSPIVDSLPEFASAYALSSDAVEAYRRDGHVLLRGVASPGEIAPFRDAIRAIIDEHRRAMRPIDHRDTYHQAFVQVANLWERDVVARRFVMARRFARIAADLMGVGGVRLYHDQALYKESGGGHTPWHQDQHYWPIASDDCITLWMPLVDADEEMGTMSFASGSHRDGYLGNLPISDDSHERFAGYVHDKGFGVVHAGPMRAGDATFHGGWTLHTAPPNRTDRAREVMTIIYYADRTAVSPIDNDNRQADLNRWFPGLAPGDVAASELNPVLYRRGADPMPDRAG